MKQLRRVAAVMLFTGLLGVAVDTTSESKAQVDALSPQELDRTGLIAYLKPVEGDTAPGVTETTITIGTIIPTEGPLSEMGEAMRRVLAGYFDEINIQGGVYNRKLVLRIAEIGGDQASTNLKSLMQSNQVFALVGGVSAGLDDQIVALAQSEQIPVIGPATLLPRSASNDHVFYLTPGIDDQARALVSFAAQKPELRKSKLSLLASKQEMLAGVANIENHARSLNWSLVRHDYERSTFNASQLIEILKADKSDTLLIIGSKEEAAAILKEAAAAKWAPSVLMLGVIGGGVVSSMPASFQGRVFASFPTVPTDISAAGIAEFRALQEKYKLTNRHVAAQLSALAAAKLFVETLKQSGKDLTRIKLIHALQQVSNFETGVSRPVTFGPKERVGSRGSYIVGVDAEKKEFMPAPIWVKSN